jgi:rhodanese-related sulfurtransferase
VNQFLLENWIWILAALTSGAMLAGQGLRRGGAGSVTASQAVMLMNREKAVVIDVCEPREFKEGHVAGSRNVPLGSIEGARELPSNKALPVVVVCATGARAARAAGLLRKAGHQQVVVLAGGMSAWREANLPVDKS